MKTEFIEPIESCVLLTANGLDASFGHGGIATIDVPAADSSPGLSFAATPAGEAIVGVESNSRFYLTKLKANGSTDFAFGHKGFVRLDHLGQIAVDPATGEIVVGFDTVFHFYTAAGRIDLSRGVNGLVDLSRTLSLDRTEDFIAALSFAPDGGIVFVATYPEEPGLLADHALLAGRLKADGSIDRRFGHHGVTKLGFHLGNAQLRVASDGSTYLLVDDEQVSDLDGDVVTTLTPTLVHLTRTGLLDTSLGGDGVVEVGNADEVRLGSAGIDLDPDQRVIVAIRNDAELLDGLVLNQVLRRIRPDGSFDPQLGADGVALGPDIRSIASSPSGDILLTAASPVRADDSFGPAKLELRRLDAAGKPVTSWADRGIARTEFLVLNQVQTHIAVTPDDKVLIAALMIHGGTQSYVVLRFDGRTENRVPGSAVILADRTLDIAGSSKADDIRVAMRHGQIQVRIGKSEFSFDPASVSGIHIHSGGGADHIRLGDALKNIYVEAGDGDDIVQGGSGDENISGGAGNDWLSGGTGSDSLRGYGGRDTLDGGNENDVLIGGAGDDRLVGGSGTDRMRGQDGNDTLDGGSGFDELSGDAGNDVLNAGDFQQDRVDGGAGTDRAQVDRSRFTVDKVFNVEVLR